MRWIEVLVLVAAVVGPASAETFTVTLTDEQVAILNEHANVQHELRKRSAKKGLKASAVPYTSAQELQVAVDGLIRGWDAFQAGADDGRSWTDKGPRAKKRSCEKLGLTLKSDSCSK